MKRKNKSNKFARVLIIILITLALTVVNIIIYAKKVAIPEQNNKKIQIEYEAEQDKVLHITTEEQEKLERLARLKTMNEANRIKTYVGEYLKLIEEKRYSEAYDFLYPEFKQNYLSTLSEFIDYIDNTQFPDLFGVYYNDIYSQGIYYVVSVDIRDLLNTKEDGRSFNFIVKENNYDDFELSFQILTKEVQEAT